MIPNETKRIGELLVSKGLVRPWQLNLALEEQRANHDFLGAILVKKGWLKEDALLQALAEQFGLRYIRLVDEDVDWKMTRHFSASLMKDHHCVPVRMNRETVTVAMCNPLDAWAMSELQREAGFRKVEVVLAQSQEIDSTISWCQQEAMKAIDASLKEHS